MKRVLLSGLLGGVAMFAWGGLSYTVLPWHRMTMLSFRQESVVATALREQATQPGVYVVPGFPDAATMKSPAAESAWDAAMKRGPRALVVYRPEGADPKAPRMFLVGLLLEVAIASLAGGLLGVAAPALPGYWRRVIFVSCFGVLAALTGPLMEWNWMAYDTSYAVVNALDVIIAFVVVGLVVAALVRPKRAS